MKFSTYFITCLFFIFCVSQIDANKKGLSQLNDIKLFDELAQGEITADDEGTKPAESSAMSIEKAIKFLLENKKVKEKVVSKAEEIDEDDVDFSNYNLLFIDDPMLWEPANSLTKEEMVSKETKAIAKRLMNIIQEYKEKGRYIAGLSAPQIGINKKIFVFDVLGNQKDASKYEVFINPIRQWLSNAVEEDGEQCLSTGNIVGVVKRAVEARIAAYNMKGELIFRKFRYKMARAILHQMDHLDGIRFPNRIDKEKELHVAELNERELYKYKWHNWGKTISYEEWKIISGMPEPKEEE